MKKTIVAMAIVASASPALAQSESSDFSFGSPEEEALLQVDEETYRDFIEANPTRRNPSDVDHEDTRILSTASSAEVVEHFLSKKSIEAYQTQANAGDGLARLIVGLSHTNGDPLPEDQVKAKDLFQLACEQGNSRACFNLGYHLAFGEGDSVQGAAFFKRACETGNAKGCYEYGKSLRYGDGIPQDFPGAVAAFASACEQNLAQACNDLGVRHQNGEGVQQSYRNAAQLYGFACQLENSQGCNNLGVLFENGWGTNIDYVRAAQFYNLACVGEDALACDNLGKLQQSDKAFGENYLAAQKAFQKACDLGRTESCASAKSANDRICKQLYVQERYRDASVVCQSQSRGGNTSASFYMGRMHERGIGGLEKSAARAAEYYKLRADTGGATAQFNLGLLYRKGGDDLSIDYAKAWAYFRKAADQNNENALGELASMTLRGEGRSADKLLGLKYYLEAQRLGATKHDSDIPLLQTEILRDTDSRTRVDRCTVPIFSAPNPYDTARVINANLDRQRAALDAYGDCRTEQLLDEQQNLLDTATELGINMWREDGRLFWRADQLVAGQLQKMADSISASSRHTAEYIEEQREQINRWVDLRNRNR